jgi:hypothetical protein
MRSFLIALTRNPISLTGAAITTASGVLVVTLFTLELFGMHGGAYSGIIAYLILPAIFVLGLLLIPIGILRERQQVRRAAARGEAEPSFPVIDLNLSRTRTRLLIFVLLTALNIVILSTATYKGVEVMESTAFCGQACHSVMQPEFDAYQDSPHSRVKCVSCHIGPGANWFVKSKLSGTWQVVSVNLGLYPRPIPTPVHALRPARETCEQCHWPLKFVGDRLTVYTHYGNDEANTEMKTVLLLRVGGLLGRESQGIHWHVDPGIEIRYRSDESRDTIYDVEMTAADGTVKLYTVDDAPEENPEAGPDEWRVMDCMDCHNRPSHAFELQEREVDAALAAGRMPRTLPYIRREGVAALQHEYASHDEARAGIASAIEVFYGESYPELAAQESEAIAEAGRVLGDIYTSFDGCFRCHDDLHATEDGEVISQDCETCHTLLAMEEEEPEVLELLQP